MGLKISYRRHAAKELQRLPPMDRQRVIVRLTAYADAPDAPHHDVIHLVGSLHFRLRVGDWRVVFEVADGQLDVVKVGHRREIYR